MFRTILNCTAALLLVYSVPANVGAQTPAPAAPAAATATVDADPALWVVKDEDTTIYLFGTFHALKPGLSWFDEAVKDAFDKSDELVLEIVMPEDPATVQAMVMKAGVNPSGPSLTEKLPTDKREPYARLMTELGVPPQALDRLDPWLAAMTITQLMLPKMGFTPENGAEQNLTKAAKAAGKPIGAVETVEQQFGFLDGMSEKGQIAMLTSTVDQRAEIEPMTNRMLDLWAKGDAEGLASMIAEGSAEAPEMYEAIFTRRNANWAKWIDARMDKPGTVFMAVGAGHLAGKDSVIELLKPMKIEAKRIAY